MPNKEFAPFSEESLDWVTLWQPAIYDLMHGHPQNMERFLQDENITVPMYVRKFLAGYISGKFKKPRRKKLKLMDAQRIRIAAIKYEKIRKRSWHEAVRFRAEEVERLAKLLSYTEQSMEKLFQKYLQEAEKKLGIKR